MEEKKIAPLIPWIGGKRIEIKYFKHYFPENFETYIEPFVGGGAVYFNLNHNKNVISDVNPELISYYKMVKEGKGQEIVEWCKKISSDKKTFYEFRDNFEPQNEEEIVKKFLYINTFSFAHMVRYNNQNKLISTYGHGSDSKGRKGRFSKIKDITGKHLDLLKKTIIYNYDFEKIFELYNDETNFMFLDPPYLGSKLSKYGKADFTEEDHLKLSHLFKTTKNKCLMIVNSTPLMEELYKDYIVETYDIKYPSKKKAGDKKTHLIIKNY